MPRVEVWPGGDHNDGCAQYRLIMPAEALAAQGADVTYNWRGPTILWSGPWDGTGGKSPPPNVECLGLAKTPEADIVVIQRPARRWWTDIIPYLQAAGIKVVVDMDDMLASADVDNRGMQLIRDKAIAHVGHDWIDSACRLADLVTVTTPALAKRYGHGRVAILPNYVPERYLLTFGYAPSTIGWSGTVGTHPRDLQVTGGAVQTALDIEDWDFLSIGKPEGVRELLELRDPVSEIEWTPFAEYALELARLTIGIVPLADTKFNHGKSALKLMEMTACGAAVVASPTPDNARMNAAGVGVMASTPQQWRKRLSSLVKSAQYRADVVGTGRAAMRAFTYERNCERWWDAWSQTLDGYTRSDAARGKLDRMTAMAEARGTPAV